MTIDDEKIVVETMIGADMNQTMDGKKDGDRSMYASKVATNGSSGVVGSKALGSRQVVRIEAYMASILDIKSKTNKKGAPTVEVIPNVEGHQPIVVEHVPKIVSGSHSAV
ncbi:hypothetical protein V6N13_098491 [Hibiscus sabdariffa]